MCVEFRRVFRCESNPPRDQQVILVDIVRSGNWTFMKYQLLLPNAEEFLVWTVLFHNT